VIWDFLRHETLRFFRDFPPDAVTRVTSSPSSLGRQCNRPKSYQQARPVVLFQSQLRRSQRETEEKEYGRFPKGLKRYQEQSAGFDLPLN
jgi:hypothetical protein